MKSVRWNLFALLAPALTLAIVLVGCNKKDESKTSSDGGSASSDSGSKSGGEKKAIEAKVRGTLKGRVILDGTPPNTASADKSIEEKMATFDKEKGTKCLVGATDEEKAAYEWRVNPQNKGVENVIVWLAPPEGTYFKLSDADKKPERMEVLFHQPHCAFIPHCDVAFTHYTEGGKSVPTGQKVVFRNDAPMAHNTNYKLLAGGDNKLLSPGESITAKINKTEKKEIVISCEVHPWMRAYLRDFDHPWAAVTDKDGNFEIKNVPADVDVQLVAWHEKPGMLLGDKGKKVKLQQGDNTQEITVPAPK
jgi:hypothetical protein